MSNSLGPAQDPGELFDVITADGRPTGRVKARARVHRDGDWHRALHVWVAGRDAVGEPFLMFQRRSPGKDTWPGRFDVTVGGHFRTGETLAEAMRELEEEIGIAASSLDLLPLGTHVCANEAVAGTVDRELQEVYLVLDDRPLTDYRPNPAELSALATFPLTRLLPFLAGESAEVTGLAVIPGASTPRPILAHHDDFIPNVDRYNLRVAIAASNVMRGDRYVAV